MNFYGVSPLIQGNRQGVRLHAFRFSQSFLQSCFIERKGVAKKILVRQKYDIITGSSGFCKYVVRIQIQQVTENIFIPPVEFPQHPFSPVSLHCLAEFTAYSYAYSIPIKAVYNIYESESGQFDTFPVFEDVAEISLPPQTLISCKVFPLSRHTCPFQSSPRTKSG